MNTTDFTLRTPRGTIRIHTMYATYDEARADGWGFWFQHNQNGEPYGIMARDNRTGAAVNATYNG